MESHSRLLVPLLLALAAGLPLACSRAPSVEASSTDERPAGAPTEASALAFVDVAASAGLDVVSLHGDPRRWYIVESNGNGAAWLDYDADGDMDLYVGNGAGLAYHEDGRRLEVLPVASSRLYRNEGDWRFTDVTDEAGARRSEWNNAVTTGDVDNDGDPDLYLANFGPDVFLRNEGGRFVDATHEAGLGNELWAAGAVFGDVDNDGHLDLYVANYVLFDPDDPPDEGRRNVIEGVEVGWGPEEENQGRFNHGAPNRFWRGVGAGRFVEATETAGLGLETPLCSYAAVFSDVDGDGWQDLLVANDLQPCNLFHNQGDGTFREEGELRGFATDAEGRATSAMGLCVEDVDGDGDQDVLRTNFDFEPNNLHLNDGRGHFSERTASFGLSDSSMDKLAWGAAFLDAECDGDLDLMVANGHVYPQAEQIGMSGWLMRTQLYEAVSDGRGGLRWHDLGTSAGSGLAPLRSARGLAVADADDDGDLDAVVIDIDEPPRLLENRSARRGRWIAVRTVGRSANRDGLGALVRVTAGGRTWTREMRTVQGLYSSHDPRLHFGLGRVDAVERVEVLWPGGARSTVEDPALDAVLIVHQPENAEER
jgi:hypothetical protein